MLTKTKNIRKKKMKKKKAEHVAQGKPPLKSERNPCNKAIVTPDRTIFGSAISVDLKYIQRFLDLLPVVNVW